MSFCLLRGRLVQEEEEEDGNAKWRELNIKNKNIYSKTTTNQPSRSSQCPIGKLISANDGLDLS